MNVHLCFACVNEQHANTVYTSVWNRSVAHVCTEQDFYYTHLSGHLTTCSTLITDSSFVPLSCTSWSQPIEHDQQRSNSLSVCRFFCIHTILTPVAQNSKPPAGTFWGSLNWKVLSSPTVGASISLTSSCGKKEWNKWSRKKVISQETFQKEKSARQQPYFTHAQQIQND